MNPFFALALAEAATFDAACPDCGKSVRYGSPCASCGLLTVDGRPVKPGFRRYAPPPDEVVADLKAQLDAITPSRQP